MPGKVGFASWLIVSAVCLIVVIVSHYCMIKQAFGLWHDVLHEQSRNLAQVARGLSGLSYRH